MIVAGLCVGFMHCPRRFGNLHTCPGRGMWCWDVTGCLGSGRNRDVRGWMVDGYVMILEFQEGHLYYDLFLLDV